MHFSLSPSSQWSLLQLNPSLQNSHLPAQQWITTVPPASPCLHAHTTSGCGLQYLVLTVNIQIVQLTGLRAVNLLYSCQSHHSLL